VQAALILRVEGLKCCPSHLGFSVYDQIFPSLPLKACPETTVSEGEDREPKTHTVMAVSV